MNVFFSKATPVAIGLLSLALTGTVVAGETVAPTLKAEGNGVTIASVTNTEPRLKPEEHGMHKVVEDIQGNSLLLSQQEALEAQIKELQRQQALVEKEASELKGQPEGTATNSAARDKKADLVRRLDDLNAQLAKVKKQIASKP